MQAFDFNSQPIADRQWQSGVFWASFYKNEDGSIDKVNLSWPWRCEAISVPMPDDCKTEEDAMLYLRKQMVDGLMPENGVFSDHGPIETVKKKEKTIEQIITELNNAFKIEYGLLCQVKSIGLTREAFNAFCHTLASRRDTYFNYSDYNRLMVCGVEIKVER